MHRTDDANAVLTGMIFAAIFVILLVSFSRESYVMVSPDVAAGSNSMTLFFANTSTRNEWARKLLCPARRAVDGDSEKSVSAQNSPEPRVGGNTYGLASEAPMEPCAPR